MFFLVTNLIKRKARSRSVVENKNNQDKIISILNPFRGRDMKDDDRRCFPLSDHRFRPKIRITKRRSQKTIVLGDFSFFCAAARTY